jgi:two-component system, OmpR family, heavy metal sensor histidine kinase CusS
VLRPSFRVKIALLSTLLSGAVLLAFALLFLAQVKRLGLERIDREILALGESQLKVSPDRDASLELDRSLRFLYGPTGPSRYRLRLRTTSDGLVYRSPEWPPELAETRLPSPKARRGEPAMPPSSRAPPPIRSAFATLRGADTAWRVGVLEHPRAQVVLAHDLRAFESELASYRTALGLSGTLALLLLAASGNWLARRALRPIETLTRTAERITRRGLGERVPAIRADREIAELIAVINGMLERLERSFQQAARFSADAAHELQTPLTILQGQLEQSLQEVPDGSAIQATLSDLLGEVQRLRSIVRKLLLLARADAGRLAREREPIDWSRRVHEVVEATRELAPHLQVRVRVLPGVAVAGDPELLGQLLRNLAGNAVKFNQGEPGIVDFELARERGWAVLRVANTGPILSAEERARIFERFFRADPARNRKIEGVGLGLALAREIALAHGGKLEVDLPRSGWVRFTLSLVAV